MGDGTTAVVRSQPSRLALFYRHLFYPFWLGLVIIALLDYADGAGARPWYHWALMLWILAIPLRARYRVELRSETLTATSLVRTRHLKLRDLAEVACFTIRLYPVDRARILSVRPHGNRWRHLGLALDFYADRCELEDAIIRAALRANPEVKLLNDAVAYSPLPSAPGGGLA